MIFGKHVHDREPLYSNSAVIAWVVVAVDEWTIWHFYVHLADENGNTFLNNLLLKVFLLIIATNISSFVSA